MLRNSLFLSRPAFRGLPSYPFSSCSVLLLLLSGLILLIIEGYSANFFRTVFLCQSEILFLPSPPPPSQDTASTAHQQRKNHTSLFEQNFLRFMGRTLGKICFARKTIRRTHLILGAFIFCQCWQRFTLPAPPSHTKKRKRKMVEKREKHFLLHTCTGNHDTIIQQIADDLSRGLRRFLTDFVNKSPITQWKINEDDKSHHEMSRAI